MVAKTDSQPRKESKLDQVVKQALKGEDNSVAEQVEQARQASQRQSAENQR